MAKAPAKTSPEPSPKAEALAAERADHPVLRAFDAIYRFLASVKLAVICILTLAMVLGGATFFESSYGIPAVRQYVYGHPAFAVLLAFLGVNIFCAATIRYPWKRRQLGFVVTHVGLLVVLAGAFVSLRGSDEGQLGMPEGTTSRELVRIDHAAFRVEKLDPETGKPSGSYTLPFDPGAFPWRSEELSVLEKDRAYRSQVWAVRSALGLSCAALACFVAFWIARRPRWIGTFTGSLAVSVGIGLIAGLGIYAARTPGGPRRDVLTDSADPFTVVVTDHLPSSGATEARAEPDRDGYPVARISLLAKPPGATEPTDAFDGRGWLGQENPKLGRSSRTGGPAQVVFQVADGPNADAILDDFLHPPKAPNTDRAARFHYRDKAGQDRVHEWILTQDQIGKSMTLPDSDLKATFSGFDETPIGGDSAGAMLRDATGDTRLRLAVFKVKKGSEPERDFLAVSSLPLFPNSTRPEESGGNALYIGYFHPPALSARGGPMSGRFAQVEVLRMPDGRLFQRAFGRDGLMGTPGPIAIGEEAKLIASKNMPMQLALRVDEAIPKARLRDVFVDVVLPRERREEAIPALQAEMTVGGITRKLSLLRLPDINAINWETVRFPDATYRVAYDYDRYPFPFTLALKSFEPGKDPGSSSPATFRSEVELTDAELGLKDEPISIYMNHPLTHRGWSFYQSNYRRVADPETGQKDGAYASFFQVHYDPAWKIVYTGCLLVVLGTFLQFYMRAGVFTDGGKREREKADARVEARTAKEEGVRLAKPAKARPVRTPEPVEDL